MLLNKITPIRSGVSNCQLCGGVGFLLEENVDGSRSGELFLCTCVTEYCAKCDSMGKPPYLSYDNSSNQMIPCFCHDSRTTISHIEKLVDKACIPPKYKYKFLNYSIDTSVEMSILVAHDWADTLVNDWKKKDSRRGMYLWGGTGTGKTLIACVILNELIFRYKVDCRYAKINKDFLSALKDTYSKESEWHGRERSIEMEFAEVDVLVIDDFGVQKDTEWGNAKLYDLIDSRYEKEKITLLTSNSPLTDWKDKGEGRVYSRLCEMTNPIHLTCSDYRERFIR